MKKTLSPCVSRPGYSLTYSILETSKNTLRFHIHETKKAVDLLKMKPATEVTQ